MHQLSIRARAARRRRRGAVASGGGGGAASRRAVAGDRARPAARGRGRQRARPRDAARADGAPARRALGAGGAGQAAAPDGQERRGAGAAAHGAGAAAAGSRAQALPRSARRRRGRRSRRTRRARPPLRRGRADAVAAARPRRRPRPDRERRGGPARSPRGARAPERAVANLRPARRPGADRTRRRGEQGVRRPLHAGPRRGRHPPGARVPARTRAASSTTLEATDRSDEDLSEPWYGLYYDNRAEVVRFEGLRPGDVVEIQYLVDDVGSDNQMADYFGDLQYIGETIPKRRWDYTLIAPVSRPIHANVPRLPRLDRQVSVRGERSRLSLRGRATSPKIDAEPAMPGVGEIVARTCTSAPTRRWNDVGAWYWRLVEESLGADDEIRRTARGLVTARHERRRARARRATTSSSRGPATSGSSSASTATSPTR